MPVLFATALAMKHELSVQYRANDATNSSTVVNFVTMRITIALMVPMRSTLEDQRDEFGERIRGRCAAKVHRRDLRQRPHAMREQLARASLTDGRSAP